MTIKSTEVIQAIDKAEIDMQIATAKQYPRDIAVALNNMRTYAMMDSETAQECFYAVARGGNAIEGVSVRFAEIVAESWGNLRVATRITYVVVNVGDHGSSWRADFDIFFYDYSTL